MTRRQSATAFTLIELLVALSIIGALTALLLPALGSARAQGRAAVCLSNLRQLSTAWMAYANDYDDRCMPLAYWSADLIGTGPPVFWWGTDERIVEPRAGFLWPYLQSPLSERSVFECPAQPRDCYRPQGAARNITSTYGYNGYYLSPPHTPGWAFQIGHRPWQEIGRIRDAARVFAFADTLIDLGGRLPFNTALLDPPQIFSGNSWSPNPNPTTAFRHSGRTHAVHVDGHVERYVARPEWLTSCTAAVGSVGVENGPHYVPDWRDWIEGE